MGAALVFLVVAVLLAAAEVATGELFLLSLAGGALAAAGSAAVIGGPLWVDVLVFAVVSVGLVVGVRPPLLRKLRSGPQVRNGADALSGRSAVVLEQVDEQTGRVKLAGEVWSARALEGGGTFEPGRTVRVMQIDGATAVVYGES